MKASIDRLKAEQALILDKIYAGLTSPEKSVKGHQELLQQYEKTVAGLQSLHPLRDKAPCWFCDSDLYNQFSDISKEVCGVRIRSDASRDEIQKQVHELRKKLETMNANQEIDSLQF